MVTEGQRFGYLTAIEKSEKGKGGKSKWICKCDCGNITNSIYEYNLKNGHTKSCGCIKSITFKHEKHGMRNTKLYSCWKQMRQRCSNQNNSDYKKYGGRGIKVCDDWENDFQSFYDYVSQLPHFGEEGYSLDRINNDGNYEPGNVRWATRYEQTHNRRCSRKVV